MTAPTLKGPQAGSRAYMALKKLHAFGGSAAPYAWMNAASWTAPVNSFHKEIVTKLVVRGLVFARDGEYKISDAGLEHIGVDLNAAPTSAPVVAGPRYVPDRRELEQRHKVRLPLTREGALDYLAIPSRHGNVHLVHKTSIAVDNGAQRG